MKDLLIDEMNKDDQIDIDWNSMEPPPCETVDANGRSMWVINGYKIWAKSYMEALELLPMIESF
jgi:hypothetical protein